MAHTHRQITLADRSAIGEARRTANALAEALGFDEEQRSNIGIVVTEAATNVMVHAQGGELVLCANEEADGAWLDLLALDCGPGIRDVAEASADGYSSNGTAGEGLGAIRRQSDESGIYSIAGRGAAIWSRFYQRRTKQAEGYGAVSVPLRGETACGDSFFVSGGPARAVYMMADGLGHGPQAAEAAQEAVLTTQRYTDSTAQEIVLNAHDALRKTRGAAMSVAVVDYGQGVVSYAGVGNIGASIQRGPQTRTLVSQNGTLGAMLPRQVQEYRYPFEPGSLLVLSTDGLSSKTSLSGYAGIQNRHPQLIAGVLYRDFSRKRDDATVLVARLDGSRT